jgi:hypothetical protein
MDEIRDIAKELMQSVMPIVALVIIIQLILFDDPLHNVLQFIIGAIMLSLGLGIFLLGVKVGLMRLGELIGSELPQRVSFLLLVFFVFLLGIAITVAEPDVQVLAQQVAYVSDGGVSKNILVTFVGLGVGLFLAIAAARVLLGIPMAYLLVFGYLAVFALSYFVPPGFVPVSFDSGGVTTGPMTVPFIMALGVGLTSVIGGKSSLGDSFGFVALASIGPILAVMLLGVIYG